MKKLLLLTVAMFTIIAAWSQVKSGDAELDKRLAVYLKLNEQAKFDEMAEYLHPNLFKIAPKEAIISSMRSAFESEEMTAALNNLSVTAFGAPFTHNGSVYRKVNYNMSMTIRFNDTTVYEPEFIKTMTEAFTASSPGKKVSYDAKTKKFTIKGPDVIYAIKDKGQPWLFLGFQKDEAMISQLFPKAVIDHYKMLE